MNTVFSVNLTLKIDTFIPIRTIRKDAGLVRSTHLSLTTAHIRHEMGSDHYASKG